MVNFTVTIPEDLKGEMDRYQEVNWSEVFRKSVQSYIQARKNPKPSLDFECRDVFLNSNWALSKPDVLFQLLVKNMMDVDVILDRILMDTRFYDSTEASDCVGGFECKYLEPHQIPANSSLQISVRCHPDEEFVRMFSDYIENTFVVDMSITAYVQGFVNPSIKPNLQVKVPFDEWKKQAKFALELIDRKRTRMMKAAKQGAK